MRRNPPTAPKKRKPKLAGALSRAKGSKVLSFSDLEIPVEPLLTREEEFRSGTRIRVALRRLAWLVPNHPAGYRRFLARLEEVSSGGTIMFTWLALKERMEADLALAARALDRARAALRASATRALRHYAEGVRVLVKYPLDPETLYQWAREVRGELASTGPLGALPRFARIDRILGRVLRSLEKERDRLVLPNFRLVLKEVFRYHPTGMKRSDLFQEGILGLHKAVFRFDAARSIRFSTYATYWIRQSIRKSLIDKSRMIRVPQAIQEELRKADPALKPGEAERVRRIMSDTVLFSSGESDDSSDRFSFEVKDPSTPELGESLHLERVPQLVNEALRGLSSRERDVVQRRFGLGGERPQTLEEIGVHLNLSRERIRQIEQEALARMRNLQELQDVYEDLDSADVTAANTHN
ncbi:MAG: sigma-70 family RNA polymerase sigma factor [Planctomycetota bacterium]